MRFLYDDTIFSKGVAFDPETIRSRLRELAFLNSRATIRFRWVQIVSLKRGFRVSGLLFVSGSWPS